MFNKKSRIGKKSAIMEISIISLVFSFLSIMYIFISLFGYAVANDYLFYNLQNITENLESQGIIKNGTSKITQGYGDDFTNFNLHLDDLWFISYLVFIISSLVVCYKADRHNYFSFLGLLFYGLMFFLLMLSIFYTAANWFKEEILLRIIPNAYILVPKFYFYLDHIGIFSSLHFVACLLANMFDFDFSKIFQKKKLEEKALEDNEVL